MNKFFLTKTALKDMKNIYDYSLKEWGEVQASKYLESLYDDFKLLANNKNLGKQKYNLPFFIYPSCRHSIVYQPHQNGIFVITVLNQLRDIEGFLREFGKELENEIVSLIS